MKKLALLALAGSLFALKLHALSLGDIPLWTGSGTNRAALVVEWSSPESAAGSSVPAPVADKTLVWGYRFNGPANGTQMLQAIVAADPKLYVVVAETYGTFVEAIGYNQSGNGVVGITDGTVSNYFTNGLLIDDGSIVDIDAAHAINSTDLYWGGYYGPNWEPWNELSDNGGFEFSPNRGTNEFWTPTDLVYFSAGTQGQWQFAQAGLDDLPLTNGSWIAFSVAAGEYESDSNAPYNGHKHAPPSPDGTYVAYVGNSNDFAVQVISTNNIASASAYNDPTAFLGSPTLRFLDPYDGGTTDRVSLLNPPYNKNLNGTKVLTEIKSGGQITVQLGRKIFDDPNNPYGIDFIVYGYSFYSAADAGTIDDGTDFNAATMEPGVFGHPTTVAVSQDGTNWYTYATINALLPANAYRWDDTNDSWTDEKMNPTKPVNPAVASSNFTGQSLAVVLDQFAGAVGGTGYDLRESGLPWIQFVRVTPGTGTYTVLDAIAAVNPVAVGDAQSITPANLAEGMTNLLFQSATNSGPNLLAFHFNALSDFARVSTVALPDLSSYAPVVGTVSSAYKISVQPVMSPAPLAYLVDVSARTGAPYTGTGSDLRVYEWAATNWISQPFVFNPTNDEVSLLGLTNLSAVVVTQIIPPILAIQNGTNSYAFQFVPVPNVPHTLERSIDLVNWTPVGTITPTTAQTATLSDNTPPAGKAFYRLSLNVP